MVLLQFHSQSPFPGAGQQDPEPVFPLEALSLDPSQAQQPSNTPPPPPCGPLYVTAMRNEVQMSFSIWWAPADSFCRSAAVIAAPYLPFMPCSAQTPFCLCQRVY